MTSKIDETAIKLEKVRCDLCGGNASHTALRSCNLKQSCDMEYEVVSCDTCGLMFLNPRPVKDSLNTYYVKDDPEKAERELAFYEKVYFSVFRRIPLASKGKVLDIGCGAGRYIYSLRERGWDVAGVDIGYTDYGRRVLGLDIREGDVRDLRFGGASFDAVTMWWTLEHMNEPSAILRESFRILKKGGVAVVGVPNIASLEARIFKRYWFHLFLPKHLYQFSPASLTAMLKKAGFTRVVIRHDLFSFGFLGSLQCFLNARGIKASFTNPVFYLLSLPFDILLGVLKNSGLITAYAYKD